MSESKFLEHVRKSSIQSSNNYQFVIIKSLIESSFDDDVKSGKRTPHAANPPVLSASKIHSELKKANSNNVSFEPEIAVQIASKSLGNFLSISENGIFSLTLEFNRNEIPKILEICNQIIDNK